MKFQLEPDHRNVSDDVLIQDVTEVAARLGRDTVTMHEYRENGKYHPTTLTRRFKSWFKVLERAKLVDSRSRINISDENLFNNIRELWITLARQPKYDEIKKPESKYSAGTYEKRFGSWRKALEAFVKYMEDESSENLAAQSTNLHLSGSAVTASAAQLIHKTKREISARMQFSILLRDGFRCHSCGRSPITCPGVVLHVDHISPWSKGGETVPENLQSKCKECNLGKGNAFDK